MIGMTVKHSTSGIVGIVNAVTVDPSGAGMVRSRANRRLHICSNQSRGGKCLRCALQ